MTTTAKRKPACESVTLNLEDTAKVLHLMFKRLDQYEALGSTLLERCQKSAAVRLSLEKELPLLRTLFPDEKI